MKSEYDFSNAKRGALVMIDINFILNVLRLAANYDFNDGDLWWRTDGEYSPVTFFINCNDFFWWGTSDCEKIEKDDLESLEKALKDADKAYKYGHIWGPLLWCARKRNMRPQGPYYSSIPKELWPLFNDCGLVREVDFGNPCEPGQYKGGKRTWWRRIVAYIRWAHS